MEPASDLGDVLLPFGEHDSVNFTWLSERCFQDTKLMVHVLHTFLEQGKANLLSMRNAVTDQDSSNLIFYAVCNPYLACYKLTDFRAFFLQNFLAESSSNVGATVLEQLCQFVFMELSESSRSWPQTMVEQTMRQVM